MSNFIYVLCLIFVYVFEIVKLFSFEKRLISLEKRVEYLEKDHKLSLEAEKLFGGDYYANNVER